MIRKISNQYGGKGHEFGWNRFGGWTLKFDESGGRMTIINIGHFQIVCRNYRNWRRMFEVVKRSAKQ